MAAFIPKAEDTHHGSSFLLPCIGGSASSTSTTRYDIWGNYGVAPVHYEPPGVGNAVGVTIRGTSANDAPGGTGCRTLDILYLDDNMDLCIMEDVNAPGAGTAALPDDAVAVVDMWPKTFGSGGAVAGIINVEKTVGGAKMCIIPAGASGSNGAFFMVPRGYEARLNCSNMTIVGKSLDTIGYVEIMATTDYRGIRDENENFYRHGGGNAGNASMVELSFRGERFPEYTIIKARGARLSGAQPAFISARLNITLERV